MCAVLKCCSLKNARAFGGCGADSVLLPLPRHPTHAYRLSDQQLEENIMLLLVGECFLPALPHCISVPKHPPACLAGASLSTLANNPKETGI